jgi:hypothetical protein
MIFFGMEELGDGAGVVGATGSRVANLCCYLSEAVPTHHTLKELFYPRGRYSLINTNFFRTHVILYLILYTKY